MPEIFFGAEMFRTRFSAFFCPSSGALLAARGGVAQSHTSSMLLRAAGISGFVLHPESGQKGGADEAPSTRAAARVCVSDAPNGRLQTDQSRGNRERHAAAYASAWSQTWLTKTEETEYYGILRSDGGEIGNSASAFAVSRHSHLRTGSNNAISVSSVFHIGFLSAASVRVSAHKKLFRVFRVFRGFQKKSRVRRRLIFAADGCIVSP